MVELPPHSSELFIFLSMTVYSFITPSRWNVPNWTDPKRGTETAQIIWFAVLQSKIYAWRNLFVFEEIVSTKVCCYTENKPNVSISGVDVKKFMYLFFYGLKARKRWQFFFRKLPRKIYGYTKPYARPHPHISADRSQSFTPADPGAAFFRH